MNNISPGRVLWLPGRKFITGVSIAETGEVYLAVRGCVIPGEILRREITHPADPERGFLTEGRSVLNYEVLDCVHPNTVRAAIRRVGRTKPFKLLPRAVWVSVHGD